MHLLGYRSGPTRPALPALDDLWPTAAPPGGAVAKKRLGWRRRFRHRRQRGMAVGRTCDWLDARNNRAVKPQSRLPTSANDDLVRAWRQFDIRGHASQNGRFPTRADAPGIVAIGQSRQQE